MWSIPTTIDSGQVLKAVSCAAGNSCVAVDNNGNALTDNGGSWSSASSIDPGNTLHSVSCATTALCVAVDSHGNALTDSGGTWSSPTSIDSSNTLESVSCPTVNFCAAVDAVGNALTFPPQVSITTTSLPPATFGHRYTATLEASGGNPPYIWSARLPRGLHLNKTTGVISGVARHPGPFVVKVTLRDQKIRISGRPATQNRVAARFVLTTS